MKILAWLSTWMAVCLQAQAVMLRAPRLCDHKWLEFEGRCYFLSERQNVMTWQMAQEVCDPYRPGAVLAREDSSHVAFFLRKLMKYRGQIYWIGLADTNRTATFDTWSDGTPVTYSRWRAGRPSGANSTGRCVVTTLSGWVDTDCESFHSIICQYDLPPPPTTTETPTTQRSTSSLPPLTTLPPTTTTSGMDAVPYDFIGADAEDAHLTDASGATQSLVSAFFLLVTPVLSFYLVAL